jgi:glycosyltransferase involved in cell wall biosynthesis
MYPISKPPLVSVVCLCYNHAPFLEQTLRSVLAQSYPNIEVVLVDNGSSDSSRTVMQDFLATHEQRTAHWRCLFFDENLGNCAAFNRAFAQTTGEFLIDLSTDDVLADNRIAIQVACLQQHAGAGVCFTNAYLIDTQSRVIGKYYPDHYAKVVRQGAIFADLLRAGGMICAPTMLIRRQVLEHLGGYDETLSYEDYDFWVRSSRNFDYVFIDDCLTYFRRLPHSHSKGFFKKRQNQHLRSTYTVLQKATFLVQNQAEKEALLHSLSYHLRLAIRTQNQPIAKDLLQLHRELAPQKTTTQAFYRLCLALPDTLWEILPTVRL